jgi:regulator of CtrA degradation
MASGFRGEADPIAFGERLAGSQSFAELFREGMTLVEETAGYLDGDGRAHAKALGRSAALAYATESMRLTTRLMQIASWLLLHRAVNEGEMSLVQARKEKTRVKVGLDHRNEDAESLLPAPLQELIARSLRIQERVQRMDATLHRPQHEAPAVNPIERQLGLIKAAFAPGQG